MATQESLNMAQQFYVAYYGRPADPAGLVWWADKFDGSDNLEDALSAFGASDEFDENFGEMTNEELINNLYQQMFGRDAEQDGIDFYAGLLESGEATLVSLAKNIADGADGDDATVLANKIAVAQTYTNAVESLGSTYEADDIADAMAILAAVDVTEESVATGNEAALVEVESNVPEDVPEPSVPGEDFFLTANQDILTGTANDDTFIADVVQVNGPQVNTLGTGDRLDGGEGHDVLEAQVAQGLYMGNSNMAIQPRIRDIEEIKFEALESNLGQNGRVTIGGLEIKGVDKLINYLEDLAIKSLSAIDHNSDGLPNLDSMLGETLANGFASVHEIRDFFDYIRVQANTVNDVLEGLSLLQISVDTGIDIGVNSDVFVNAKNIYGVDEISSWHSDANLVVTDVNTMTSEGNHDIARNTSDMTIGMRYTGSQDTRWEASDMHVYFDQDFLLTGKDSESQAIFYLLDQDADLINLDVDGDGVEDLLAEINANGLRFTVDGGAVQTIQFDQALLLADGNGNRVIDHASFVAALQPALAQAIAQGLVPADTTLKVNPALTDFTFLDDGSRSSDIPAIVLETKTDAILKSVGFKWVDEMVGEYNVYGRLDSGADVAAQPLSVNVALEKVGRGGDGGELIIGSMDKYAHGIDEFYVTVYGDDAGDHGNGRPSSLSRLDSTGNQLDKIFITSDNDGYPGNSYADLTIGNGLINGNPVNDGMTLIQSNGFMGDLNLGTSDATRVVDLATLNTTDMAGDTSFWAEVGTRGKYDYKTGSGDDYINIDLNGDAVDTVFTGLSIATNAGNDEVYVADHSFGGNPQIGVSQMTMFGLNNLSINTGAGDDYVELSNNFRFNIDAGAGSDFVYIKSDDSFSMCPEGEPGSTGEWVISTPTGLPDFNTRVLYKAQLTVTFAGFEETVNVKTDSAGNFIANQLTINAAIREAIDRNPELSRLLDYTVEGPLGASGHNNGTSAQQLIIRSTIDGENFLGIDLYQPQLLASTDPAIPAVGQVRLATGDATSLLTGIIATDTAENSLTDPLAYVNLNFGSQDEAGAGNITLWDGEAVTLDNAFLPWDSDDTGNAEGEANVNFSVINMGSGANDLVVLDSNDDSANVLVIDQNFGKVSVVNFFTDFEDASVGNHAIDYTHYLNNLEDFSVNTPSNLLSADFIDVTLATTNVVEANQVQIITMTETAAQTFDNLTAAALVNALNNNSISYADINDGTSDAAVTTTGLVGTLQNHIFMVENANNLGEYKIFHLTSSTVNNIGDFNTNGVELGILDFGNSTLEFDDINLFGNEDWIDNVVGDPQDQIIGLMGTADQVFEDCAGSNTVV